MIEENSSIYRFEDFELDAHKRLLLRNGQPVSLPSKALDLLLILIESQGRALTKQELMESLWADQIVEDANLTVTMSTLRKALGEKAGDHRFIVTIPGRGYRFIGELQPGEALIVVQHTVSEILIEHEPDSDNKAPLTPILETTSVGVKTTGTGWIYRARRGAVAVTVAAVLVGLTALGFYWWSKRAATRAESSIAVPATQIKSIAILPFKPSVSDNRDESLEMGIADTLITRLSNIKDLNVRPISAVRKYTGLEQDAIAAGREQKVDAVLDGLIQVSGDRIRITARLVSIGNGATLWAETFDDKVTDIFTVEDSISEQVARMLAVKLTGEERTLVATHATNDTEAYQLYLKGRYFRSKGTGEAIQKSIEYFNQAIAKDPNYALAYAGLADSNQLLSNYNLTTPQEAYSKARAAATEALTRNDKLAEAHSALASIRKGYDWDFAGAEREYRRAIELNPNYASARNGYGEYLGMMGRSTEAIAEMRRAQELEPLSLGINTELGSILYFAGRVDESIDQLRMTLELDSSYGRAHIELGYAYRLKRQYEEAISEFKRALDIDREDSYALSQLAHTYGLMGRRDDAYRAIGQLKELGKRQYVLPSDIAAAYAGLGEKDRAFQWLEKAYADRDDGVPFFKVDPSWDLLRSDPRFADLLRRVGLPA